MSSVAVVNTVERKTGRMRSSKAVRRTHRPRRLRTGFWKKLLFICLAVMLGGAFAYASLYASLTVTSYDRSRLASALKAETIKRERLWVEYVRRSSPVHAAAAAHTTNMVYAQDYDYLYKSNTIAKAHQDQ